MTAAFSAAPEQGVHAILIQRGGRLVYEEYFTALDQPVVEWFPEYPGLNTAERPAGWVESSTRRQFPFAPQPTDSGGRRGYGHFWRNPSQPHPARGADGDEPGVPGVTGPPGGGRDSEKVEF